MSTHRTKPMGPSLKRGLGALMLSLLCGGTALAADDFTTPPPRQPAGSTQQAPQPTQGSSGSNGPSMNAPGTSRLGHEYAALVTPVRPGSSGIEVIEFFSYGCIACAKVDALMQQWSQGVPGFVHFSASPAAGESTAWLFAARIFYALDTMNVEQRMRQELFRAITQDGLKYQSMQVLDVWLDAHGINSKAFNQAFDSNLVIAKTGNLPNVMQLYQIRGVPAVVIDGRYIVTAASAGGIDKLPGVVGDVVNQVIHERQAQGQ